MSVVAPGMYEGKVKFIHPNEGDIKRGSAFGFELLDDHNTIVTFYTKRRIGNKYESDNHKSLRDTLYALDYPHVEDEFINARHLIGRQCLLEIANKIIRGEPRPVIISLRQSLEWIYGKRVN
jgi:hypothetical protein